MKKLVLLVVALFVSLAIFAQYSADFNGDGKTEKCFIEGPKIDDSGFDCVDGCFCMVSFSDKSIAPLVVEKSIGATLDIIGDLDGDGVIEVGFYTEWFTSNWQNYLVFTYVKGQWYQVVEPFAIWSPHIDEVRAKGQKLVQRVANGSDKLFIYTSEMDYDTGDIELKRKLVNRLPR